MGWFSQLFYGSPFLSTSSFIPPPLNHLPEVYKGSGVGERGAVYTPPSVQYPLSEIITEQSILKFVSPNINCIFSFYEL